MRQVAKLILTSLVTLCVSQLSAQNGPGGVGNSSNINSWLDASTLSLSNSSPVTSWTDASGNSNNATQATASNQPTYLTNQVNGLPAISFDGSDDYLEFSSSIAATAASIFVVANPTSSSSQNIIVTDNHRISFNNNTMRAHYPGGLAGKGSPQSYALSYMYTGSNAVSPTSISLFSNNGTSNSTRTGFTTNTNNSIGAQFVSSAYSSFFQGEMAEIIVFNENLSTAQRRIVANYLASKYDLTAESNLFNFKSTHGSQVFGIGQESDGSHTTARGSDSLQISNPSALSNGEYLLVGNDGGGFTTSASLTANVNEQWDRTWRADVTGSPGSITLEFFLGSNGFAASTDYVLIIDSDGDFSSGTNIHTTGLSYNAVNNSITFTNVTLSDGDYFTLAEKVDETTAQPGDWNSISTWNCGCIPGSTENATINHAVTISGNQSVLNLTIGASGSLAFNSSEVLSINGDLNIEGSINTNTGSIEAVNASGSQNFDNNSSSIVEIYNLSVNNNAGLNVQSGGWAIANNLQVSSGGMDVSSADSVVLYSDASSTAQILQSMSNAFTGDFTLRRYVSQRSSRYGNISSPITNATIADLDDDLYLSGVGGNDANVNTRSGGTFFSIRSYDSPTDAFVTVTSTATAMPQGVGFDIYYDASQPTIDTTIDYVGTPTSGSVTVQVDQGWNLVGNPYQSFIDYGSLNSTGLSATYYIYNTTNATYDALTSANNIAPGQGFWVEKSSSGQVSLTFDEADKVNSNSSSYLRQKSQSKDFTLSLKSLNNNYKHQMSIRFNALSSEKFDSYDASYLASPEVEAPGIYSTIDVSNKKVVGNSLSSWEETHKVPVEIYSGINGDYELRSENFASLYSNYNCVYLFDKLEEKSIDLSVDSSYQFYSKKGTHARFDIIISNSALSCNELIKNSDVVQEFNDQINIRNSFENWYIDFNLTESGLSKFEVRVYNIKGQEVISPYQFTTESSGSHQIRGLDNLEGIHLIQIINDNNIISKTIKL